MSFITYRSVKSTASGGRKSLLSVGSKKSVTSLADTLRGKRVPITRFSQESLVRDERKAKKVELLLKKAGPSSQEKLERHVLTEMDEWCQPRAEFKDDADISLQPSYDIKQFSYDLNCFVRYLEAKDKYGKQFLREMEHFIANKPNLCEQYFLKRILCYKTSWPPLHTKRELNKFVTKFFQLTPREKSRVNYLMKTDMSLGS